MTTTYELTTGTREDYETVQACLVSDFISQISGAEVTNQLLGTGHIVSCMAIGSSFDNIAVTVHYDLDETKNYILSAAITSGGLKFTEESVVALWDTFMEVHTNLKHQYFVATEDAQRREREAAKLEKKRKENEKKTAGMKASAEKEIENLINNREKPVTKADEFYYTLGWLAKHIGTITAKMPDYLEEAFVKHFGDVERTIVDSTKVGPAGFTSQWRLSMEASLKKAENIPTTLTEYLNPTGKKLSKTSFIWTLIDDYGFKFGKKQDVEAIMNTIPDEYMPMFEAGMDA